MFFCTSGHHRRRLWRHDFHFQSRPLTGVDVVGVPGHSGCSRGKPLTGVDVVDAVYVVVVNFVAPLTLMAIFYSRIYRTVRLHKMSVILRDVLVTEVVDAASAAIDALLPRPPVQGPDLPNILRQS